MADESLVIEELTYSYGKDLPLALAKLSATVRPGIVTGLVGPDGAGKTTLMRLMTALLLPSSGRLAVFGLDTRSNASQLHEIIGYMPQKFGLYEDLSVIQNLRLYADLRNVPESGRGQLFARLLAFTGLEPFQQRLAGRLSGGNAAVGSQLDGSRCADPQHTAMGKHNLGGLAARGDSAAGGNDGLALGDFHRACDLGRCVGVLAVELDNGDGACESLAAQNRRKRQSRQPNESGRNDA